MKLDFSKSAKRQETASDLREPRIKVLVVDDEEINLKGIYSILKRRFEVLQASDGKQALEVLKNNPDIGIVISDHIMPGMTGIELLSQLNNINPNIVKILLTGFAALDNVIEAINKAEIYRFLTKPVSPDDLLGVANDAARLAMHQLTNKHLVGEFKKIMYPHQIDRINRFWKIQETMPVGSADAIVICFDIEDSTRIGHSENYEFFEETLKECHGLMVEYYNKDSLKANAYMVKEMGDGFICSVGFPFSSNGNMFECAFALANQFVEKFMSTTQKHLSDLDVFCSIGIAFGTVTGSFPKIGLTQYDLYGDAIIKATRYEHLRKDLFAKRGISKTNLIIIQEYVHQNLPPAIQAECEEMDLGDYRIRHDSEATKVFYKKI